MATVGIELYFAALRGNRHLLAFLVVLCAVIAAKFAEWALRLAAAKIGRQAHAELGEKVTDIAARSVFHTILLAGAGAAIALVPPPGKIGFAAFAITKSLVILVWLGFGMRLSGFILKWMTRKDRRFKVVQPVTLPLFETAAKLVLIGGAVYLILLAWNFDVTGWLASAGIVGIAVGFAAKDTLANLFAGVFIIADTPYRIGDYILLGDGERGRVSKIGLRSTRIVTRDENEITIPNSVIANSKIVNESRPWARARMHLPVGVAYGSDVDLARETLVVAAESVANVSRDPAPRARLVKFGESSLDFEVLCWIEDPTLRGQVRDAVNTAIYKGLANAGIAIPNSQRDIYIKELPESLIRALSEDRSRPRED